MAALSLPDREDHERFAGYPIPQDILSTVHIRGQKAIPALAKDSHALERIQSVVQNLPTQHRLFEGDSRHLEVIPDASVHLVVTSPPYWTLKSYPQNPHQLGHIQDYTAFLDALDAVWRHSWRVLVPGGRLIIIVGDVCLPRRRFGRHAVFPLHASIQEHCRQIGFDNLAPIIWYKIANAQFEVENGSGFLGKPYEPNGIVKNDIEYILFQRKPGGYRQPTLEARILSVIPQQCHQQWFQQIWALPGVSTRKHPAPFPLNLAERLIRMFSFVGDTIPDPFMGTGTTNVAAFLWGRHSNGIDVEPAYVALAAQRLGSQQHHQLTFASLENNTERA
jgi:DNA modification methylase